MKRCVKPKWRVGLDVLLAITELGRGFITALRDWVEVLGYPPNIHPFIPWRAMKDRNTGKRVAVEGWRAVRDYVNDWELVLASGGRR
ncbi:hypothetical protein SUGI_0494530 [Cryptomeria japonica]|nr:hypothetical protein SUGI_0494530 [Cryptomeria japonica]